MMVLHWQNKGRKCLSWDSFPSHSFHRLASSWNLDLLCFHSFSHHFNWKCYSSQPPAVSLSNPTGKGHLYIFTSCLLLHRHIFTYPQLLLACSHFQIFFIQSFLYASHKALNIFFFKLDRKWRFKLLKSKLKPHVTDVTFLLLNFPSHHLQPKCPI